MAVPVSYRRFETEWTIGDLDGVGLSHPAETPEVDVATVSGLKDIVPAIIRPRSAAL